MSEGPKSHPSAQPIRIAPLVEDNAHQLVYPSGDDSKNVPPIYGQQDEEEYGDYCHFT
jgi:hypothetical protein